MTRTTWVHPFNGVAGDMMLGALIDAGASVETIRTGLDTLGVDGWQLHVHPIERRGLGGTDVRVEANEGHVHRTAVEIIELVRRAGLAPRVEERAVAVFNELAAAEAEVHRTTPDQVHFHEVGGIDAIVDVVGTCLALEDLGIERIVVAPIATGVGIVGSAHGRIPHPAPATARILEGLPTFGLDVRVELTTPTGAALLAALADSFGALPPMVVGSSGYGAGDSDLGAHPNLLQVIVGEAEMGDSADQLVVLESNVDDLSAEYLAHSIDVLIEAGALDAWLTPIRMKKGRHAQLVSALVEPTRVELVREVLMAETGSLGVRARGVDRWAADRRVDTVVIGDHEIRVKVSAHTAKAEYDDVVAAASALGRPARDVAAEAERRWAITNQ
ncbi:MAG: nickel pincer cofactor biosynthesis protein LarC [Acidimicrobiales bacterium]